MTRFESQHVTVPKDQESLFEQLSDLQNFKDLLPEDKIEDWKASPSVCTFKVKGAAKIGLELKESHPYDKIELKTTDKTPVAFTMDIHLNKKGEQEVEAYLTCEADLNPFMKTLIEKPLRKLFDHIAERLVQVNS